MRRQRLAAAATTLVRVRGPPILDGSRGRPTSLLLGGRFLEIPDQQLELVDPLRGATEAGTLHQREDRSQLLDVQRLGVDLGVACRELTVLGRERFLLQDRERPQRLGIGRQERGC
jgi:hypothetical protein